MPYRHKFVRQETSACPAAAHPTPLSWARHLTQTPLWPHLRPNQFRHHRRANTVKHSWRKGFRVLVSFRWGRYGAGNGAIDTVSEPAPLPPIEPGQETRVSASQEKDETVLPEIRPTLSSNYVEGKESLQTPEPGDENDDNAHFPTPFVVAQVMTSVYWPSSWLRW